VQACLPDWETEDLEESRDEGLVKLHLLQPVDAHRYQLHRLIRQFLQTKLSADVQIATLKQHYCQVFLRIAQSIPATPTQSQLQLLTPAIPHLTTLTQE
jgi:hypothetical protein